MTEFRARAILCGLMAAMTPAMVRAAPDMLEAPSCGARIFVAMGFNQNYPKRENMWVPRGDLYLNGILVGAISRNPEIVILDVPAGTAELSWVPTAYDEDTRGKTRQNPIKLTLADKATASVVLDWYNDTPNTAAIGYRTEVVETSDPALFTRKRVAFHRPLAKPCAQDQIVAEAAPPYRFSAPAQSTPDPRQIARLAPLPQIAVPQQAPLQPAPPSAAPEQQSGDPDVSEAFMASLQLYYVVSARGGAPAYAARSSDGPPLYTFPDTTALNVVEVSADKRWLTVTIPGGNRTGFISSLLVTSGVRAPK